MPSLLRFALLLAMTTSSYAVNKDSPVYLMSVPNPHDYTLFANGGWDGNWYVGYNTCWIKKLPSVPPGDYTRAFIGARLGRMKLSGSAKNIWDKKSIPGTVYMAISSTTAWRKDSHVLLTPTEDIPLEGDFESPVEGTGESQWFWVEIPLQSVHLKGDNYLALWSPTPEFLSISSSPVLAAAWGGKEQDTWLLRDISGAPPHTPAPNLGAPISYFQPALALKLIPKGVNHPIQVRIQDWRNVNGDRPKSAVTTRVEGEAIETVWLEYFSETRQSWSKAGRPLWKAPYTLTLDPTRLPTGRVRLRVAVTNIWGDQAASTAFTIGD